MRIKNGRWRVLVIIGGLTVACGSTKMSMTGNRYQAKPANCEFQMLTTTPEGHWEEIAVIDVNPGSYGHNAHREIEDFKQEIAPKVCEAGGDAAIALANGYGYWIKATVLKALGPVAPASQPTQAVVGADDGGCKYDTQCKGDRICVDGICVAPPEPTPTEGPQTEQPSRPDVVEEQKR